MRGSSCSASAATARPRPTSRSRWRSRVAGARKAASRWCGCRATPVRAARCACAGPSPRSDRRVDRARWGDAGQCLAMPEAVAPVTASILRERLARFSVLAIDPAGRRRAAVAVAVTEAGYGADVQGTPVHAQWSDDTALLLTRRAEGLSAHAGQWAMPGGRIDDGE